MCVGEEQMEPIKDWKNLNHPKFNALREKMEKSAQMVQS